MEFARDYNAASDFIDANLERGLAAKTAFIDDFRAMTYGELDLAHRKAADALRALGVMREQRVAMLMLDTCDFPTVFWGAIRAGIVPVCLNTLLTAAQYRYMLADSRARVLVVSAALYETVKPALAGLDHLDHVIIAGGEVDGLVSLDDLLGAQDGDGPPADTVADEVAFWLYSSGSTGEPKGVKHVHSSLAVTAENYGRGVLGIGPDDVVFSAAKLFFAYGLGNAMTFPMAVGATAVLFAGRPTPEAVFEKLKTHQPTIYYGVPTLYAAMLADANCTPENGSARLRRCVSAGEALPEDVGKAWRARFGVDILDGIGSTEMLHIFVSNRPGEVRYGTSGVPCPGYRARLVDENGDEVADGEIGELLIAGDSAAEGYWNQRRKSRATFAGEWTHTGDKYTRDGDGFYHYCGRTDDMFKVGGIWVSPFEVEQALASHPSVLEAAVVGRADDEGLIKPMAFVILNEGCSGDGLFDELKAHVQAAVGKWKYPRWIEFVDELPKTATGKIQRFKLRQ